MRLYNTLTREKQEFVPVHPGEVRIYACGPTVYNFFHVGNARPFILFDVLRRYFEYRGYKVTFVQNFTDIDDKMIRRAAEEGVTVRQLADRFIGEYKKDAERLGIHPASHHPLATESMDDIISLIRTLEEKGYAYPAEDGMYFDTTRFEGYGKLSKFPLEELEAGARVDVDTTKRHPTDFALWKNKKEGEPFWPSPWGDGRPGWHIECSAMARRYLGETIDIHTGGQDLVFPHHENEIAQSEAASGKPFANYWLHNGFINIDNEKMSKSAGNFFTVRDILESYDADIVRFFLLSSQYRSPVNFSRDLLESASSALGRIRTCAANLDFVSASAPGTPEGEDADKAAAALSEACTLHREGFLAGMDDDFNTADALGSVFELVRAANTAAAVPGIPADSLKAAAATLRELCGVLGVVTETGSEIPAEVVALADERTAARKARDWKRSDELRDKIHGLGFEVSDTPQGQKLAPL